jgi:serine/threonine protein kinase
MSAMSTIQQLKNFIRHGKQARAAVDEASKSPEPATTGQVKIVHQHAASDPTTGAETHFNKHTAKAKRIDESNIAKLVAEENESRSKFPKYPGLERWRLVEKMGDGAFSNVYRAMDVEGIHGEVAIKVVRKYEMNSMQVSLKPKTPVS